MFNQEKSPTMDEQMKQEEAQRATQKNEALQKLLDELQKKPRELSPAELAFLQGMADLLENELAKSDQEAGIDHDDMMGKLDKINYWKNPTHYFIEKTNYPK